MVRVGGAGGGAAGSDGFCVAVRGPGEAEVSLGALDRNLSFVVSYQVKSL